MPNQKEVRYLLTKGKCLDGFNTGHEMPSLMDISRIDFPNDISYIVIGTNQSSIDLCKVLEKNLGELPVIHSPFCGIADAVGDDGVTIFNGDRIALENYIGIHSSFFDVNKFIASFPNNSILCVETQFLHRLGIPEIAKNAQLYKIDLDDRIIQQLN